MVSRTTTASVAIGAKRFRTQQFDMPAVDRDDGVLRVDACGVCGSDLKKYRPEAMAPTVLGHETVGTVAALGDLAHRRWGVTEGTRVLLEEYLPCGRCDHCRRGDYRSCSTTDNTRAGALRYGSTPVEVPPAVWGGYSQHQYLHPNTVLHRLPDDMSAVHATFAIPLGNGVQWAQIDGRVGADDAVLVIGPGQQGIACLVASLQAGASPVLVAGLGRDGYRLDLARRLGAATTINIDAEDPVDSVRTATGGAMADVVIDTSGGGAATLMTALRAARVGGTVVVASGKGEDEDALRALDLGLIRKKRLTIKGARGHSYDAVERALRLIVSGRSGIELMSGSSFGLDSMESALEAAAGGDQKQLHVVVEPWR